MGLFDTHCHLNDDRFRDDLPEVMDRAHQAGVRRILVASYDLASSRQAVEIAERGRGVPDLVACIGVHPHDARTVDEGTLPALAALARRSPKVRAIGETGLDYHYDLSPRDIQREVFRQHLRLAGELGLPVVIHERDATADCLDIVREAVRSGWLLREDPGVFHCFSGSVETAREVLAMGFLISLAGPVTFRNARKSLEVAAMLPADRLLVETDAPYLSPEPFRGRRNEPAHVLKVAEAVARARNASLETVAELADRNGCRLFRMAV